MTMDSKAILEGLRGALAAVETLAPVAQKLGEGTVIANVATIAIAASAAAQNLLDRAGEGTKVLNSNDQAEIRDIIHSLSAANDKLNGQIVASV